MDRQQTSSRLTRPLGDVAISERDFGGKSSALSDLAHAGLPVPPGFVISVEALSSCVRSAGLVAVCEGAARAEAAGDSDRARQLGRQAAAVLSGIEIPAWMSDELFTAHQELLRAPLLEGVPAKAATRASSSDD